MNREAAKEVVDWLERSCDVIAEYLELMRRECSEDEWQEEFKAQAELFITLQGEVKWLKDHPPEE